MHHTTKFEFETFGQRVIMGPKVNKMYETSPGQDSGYSHSGGYGGLRTRFHFHAYCGVLPGISRDPLQFCAPTQPDSATIDVRSAFRLLVVVLDQALLVIGGNWVHPTIFDALHETGRPSIETFGKDLPDAIDKSSPNKISIGRLSLARLIEGVN